MGVVLHVRDYSIKYRSSDVNRLFRHIEKVVNEHVRPLGMDISKSEVLRFGKVYAVALRMSYILSPGEKFMAIYVIIISILKMLKSQVFISTKILINIYIVY